MSKDLASAAAKDRLDIAKARHQRAEATYQSAKTLVKAFEYPGTSSAQVHGQRTQLCKSCSAIPILKIFGKQQQSSRTHRKAVGDLFRAVELQSSCALCKFLIEAFQIGHEDQAGRLQAKSNPQDAVICFTSDPDGKPWYTKVGIDTDISSCPFVWLQTGPPSPTGQPHICVSFEPTSSDANSLVGSDRIMFPRRRGRLETYTGSVNYELVKLWLEKCSEEHGAECQSLRMGPTSPLDIYLIDVHEKVFVPYSAGSRFIALSYVWGRGSTHGVGQITPAQGQTLPNSIPQTMVDAMTFVERIGQRYLWIDQLCIDQANPEVKMRQINLMDRIYASAYLTLVNLDGPDAEWGLPGISRPLQKVQQPVATLDSGRLMATFIYSSWDNNGTSVWDSRGWTLQERLMSQRCLIFGQTNVSLTCRSGFFHDCLSTDGKATGASTWLADDYFREDGSSITLGGPEWDFQIYDAVVSVFTGRELTHQSDALNACQGLLNRLSEADGSEFCFGLPRHDCQRALLWVPHNKHVLLRRLGFPSWSWAGWLGRTEYAYWLGDMHIYLHEDSGRHRPPVQRRGKSSRMLHMHPKPFQTDTMRIISYPSKGDPRPQLQIETTIARFGLRLVRRDGEPKKALRANSQQSGVAIGDHWTLIGQNGRSLRDEAGEYQCFELTDYLFRLKGDYSQLLLEQNTEADLMFVAHWPRIRDSEKSNKWLYNMVSALVLIRNQDGTAWRLASVLLKAEDWYQKGPQPELICLV